MAKIGEKFIKSYYRIKSSNLEFLSDIAKKSNSDQSKVLRSLLDLCSEHKDNIEEFLSGKEKEKIENLKNNMNYVYCIIDEIMETSFKRNQDITADLLAKYAIINLENFYIFKHFLNEKYQSKSIDDKITEFRKKAVNDLKDNSVIKEIFEDLKKEGLL